MKNIEQKIIKWIRKKVKEANAKGIVIGLSGGIDSSVVAVLAQKALGKENVIGIIMPCESQKEDERDALSLAQKFSIKIETIELTGNFYKFLNTLYPITPPKQMGRSNLKARLRMCSLYYIANNLNYLVCGTGNKTEIAIGYFTKYGDGASDIEPIGNLYKDDVKKLAKYLGIPQKIIDKAPSAGLWTGQTDEKEMGITYEKLDYLLQKLNNPFWAYDKEFVKKNLENIVKIASMKKNSEHKRKLPPICKL